MPNEISKGSIGNRLLVTGKRSVKRPPVWLYPQRVENEYKQFLLSIIGFIEEGTNEIIIKNLPSIVEEAGIATRTDAFPDQVDKLLDNLKIEVNSQIVGQRSKLIDIGQHISGWNNKEWRKTMNSVLGVQLFQREPWLNDQLNSFISENASLITNVTDQTYKEINGIVQRGIRSGKRVETIAKELTNETSIPGLPKGPLAKAKNRVKLIARDQVSKLNGQITRLRQTGVGIKEYIWRTSIDKRVRPIHRSKEGRKFSWDKAPSDTGHPGEDFQCRCWGEPDFSNIFEEGVVESSITKEQPEIKGVFDKATSRSEILKITRSHPASQFINTEALSRLAANKTLQMGLFKMRAGNLLTAAIKRSSKKIIPIAAKRAVKKIIPKPVIKKPVIPSDKPVIKKPVIPSDKPVMTTSTKKEIEIIIDKKVEHGIVVDKNGQIIWKGTDNNTTSVNIPDRFARNNHSIHNHPREVSFSASDIYSSIIVRERASDVVTKKYVYKMRNIKNQSTLVTSEGRDKFRRKIENLYEKEIDRVHEMLGDRAAKGLLKFGQASEDLTHEVVNRIAEKTGLFKYERVLR